MNKQKQIKFAGRTYQEVDVYLADLDDERAITSIEEIFDGDDVINMYPDGNFLICAAENKCVIYPSQRVESVVLHKLV